MRARELGQRGAEPLDHEVERRDPLVLVGDEDHPCLDGSLFLKRTVPQAALVVVPRAGHTITLEEPAAVNAALSELFSAVSLDTWMSHRAGHAAS